MKPLITLAALSFAAHCYSQNAADARFSGGDGSSCDKAVVLNVDSSQEAIHAQSAWLRARHGGGRKSAQALARDESKWYDLIDWEVPGGARVTTCFDITRAYEELGRGLAAPR